MLDPEERLWPYGTRAALLAAPVIWVLVAVVLGITERFFSLPRAGAGNTVLLVGVTLGLIPLLLLLLSYVAASRGTLDIKGIKIDFSQAQIHRVEIALPDNIGWPGAIVVDSSPMQVVSALEEATLNPIARIDIRDGNAWWVTRLMALSAGADRAGSPRVFVFVGMKENVEGAFLGWASPSSVLRALRNDSTTRGPQQVTYGGVYTKALRVAKQVAILADPVQPPAPPYSASAWTFPDKLPPDVLRYLYNPNYQQLGDSALEQVLMDQLALYGLEKSPDRLTLGRLNDLLGHCLYLGVVDLDSPGLDQISAFLDSNAPYVATVRGHTYVGLVERAAVEHIILRNLFARSRRER
jgi:hypothetical protein